jgi:hypothetical protein
MYCSVEDVRKYDTDGITTEISNSDIEFHIHIAEEQVNYYCNRRFSDPAPVGVIKATALITLYMLKDISLSTTKEIIEEKIDTITVKYQQGTEKEVPVQAITLLKPHIKRQSYVRKV